MRRYHSMHCRACDKYFLPKEKYRLIPRPVSYVSVACNAEDLIKGKCPGCKELHYNVVEVNCLDEPIHFHYINASKHAFWDERIKTSLKNDITNRSGALSVHGSKSTHPWTFRENIPIAV